METEQLVSAVNHLKVQYAALDYISEGLTKVLELDQAKAAADKHVQAAKAEVEQLKAELKSLQESHARELADFDKVCAEKIADASARAANLIADANIKAVELEGKLASLDHQADQKEQYLEALHSSIVQQEADLAAIKGEHEKVRKALAEIKAGL